MNAGARYDHLAWRVPTGRGDEKLLRQGARRVKGRGRLVIAIGALNTLADVEQFARAIRTGARKETRPMNLELTKLQIGVFGGSVNFLSRMELSNWRTLYRLAYLGVRPSPIAPSIEMYPGPLLLRLLLIRPACATPLMLHLGAQ